jgi:hypothetical protein
MPSLPLAPVTLALRLALEGTAAQKLAAYGLLAMVAFVLSLTALCLWLALRLLRAH